VSKKTNPPDPTGALRDLITAVRGGYADLQVRQAVKVCRAAELAELEAAHADNEWRDGLCRRAVRS
jgi:hypothetical protein